MDIKYADVEAMEPDSIDLCLFNGAIRNSENEHMAKLLREKAKILVAFGSCAHEGCIPGLANATTKEEIFHYVYHDSPSTVNPEQGVEPQTLLPRCPEGNCQLARVLRVGEDPGSGGGRGLLHPRLPAPGPSDLGGDRADRVRAPTAPRRAA